MRWRAALVTVVATLALVACANGDNESSDVPAAGETAAKLAAYQRMVTKGLDEWYFDQSEFTGLLTIERVACGQAEFMGDPLEGAVTCYADGTIDRAYDELGQDVDSSFQNLQVYIEPDPNEPGMVEVAYDETGVLEEVPDWDTETRPAPR